MCRRLICLVSFVVTGLSLISSAQAGEATADAYIRGASNADINYGSATSLLIKNNNGTDNDRKVYMRFDVSGTIMDASLDLTVSTNNEGGGGTTPQTFTVEVFGLAESLDHTWTENDITWNNAPANNTSNHDFTADAIMLGSFLVDQLPSGDTISFADPALVDFINADTDSQITLLFRRTTGNGSHNLGFASKEHTSYSAPTLNTIAATRAFGPDPADGAFLDATWTSLSWRAIDSAVSHDVYIGDNFDDVKNGTGDTFVGNQVETILLIGFPGYPYPNGLVPGTTYYWRIDEVNDADSNSPWKGSVWSFSLAPNTAYNPDPVDGADSVAIETQLSWTPGYGAKLHTVYLGEDFETVANATGGVPSGSASYNPGSLEQEKVYYWRIDEFDAFETHKGDVWAFATIGAVGNPQPTNGATDVAMDTTLSWTAANNTASHQVYLGLDKDTVRSADTNSPEYKGAKTLGDENYDTGLLDLGTTYYWRVDEVYNGNAVKGPVWRFTVGDYLLLEDFESYTDNDADDEAIWQSWIDGFGVAGNGAQVGYLVPPYCEQMIVHGGFQSMPLLYANETGVTNSEGVKTLTTPRDWTQAGISELSLWIRGVSGNAAEPLYVAISNSAGSPAVAAHDDPDAATGGAWREWRISLSAFADQGINLSNVDKIAIGLGSKSGMASAGGSGTMFIDDIRLYRQ